MGRFVNKEFILFLDEKDAIPGALPLASTSVALLGGMVPARWDNEWTNGRTWWLGVVAEDAGERGPVEPLKR